MTSKTHKLDISSPINISEAYCQSKNRDIRNVLLQLNSEIGEMNDWINRPHRQKEIFAGECADAIICILDALNLYYHLVDGAESKPEDVISILEEQLKLKSKKWEGQVLPKE